MTDDRQAMTEDRSQRTEDRGQRTDPESIVRPLSVVRRQHPMSTKHDG